LSTTNDCKCEWSHNLHSYPRGCSLLPLHDQLSPPKEPLHDQLSPPKEPLHDQPSPPKERPQEKEKGIHIPETNEISFSAFRTTSSMDNYNSESQQMSSSNQCFLESRPGEYYQRCIWCVNFSSQKDKGRSSFIPTNERPIPFSSGTKWSCDSNKTKVGVRELCGDECLDNVMSIQNRSSNQDSNNVNLVRKSNASMRKLQSLSELVNAVKNNCKFQKFQNRKHEWIIHQENRKYFSDAYGITDINPLLADNYGFTILFLDSRGILFEWCEYTKDMYLLGINEMEGLANLLYHPEKKLKIFEDTGEMIPDVELERQAKEYVEAEFANLERL
jgi:hypothetical protein